MNNAYIFIYYWLIDCILKDFLYKGFHISLIQFLLSKHIEFRISKMCPKYG